ncbi:MAG: UDP-3-O-(3-hydroxymyristoyl)glucosamine N-acyltransferase [Gammaproteobacteria bacterium]
MSITLGELAERFQARLEGDPDIAIEDVATLEQARPGAISFLANSRYRRYLAETAASAVIIGEADAADCPVAALVTSNPYALYARVAQLLHPLPTVEPGVHPRAWVSPEARVDASAHVGPGAVVEARARVDAGAVIGPGSVVGEGTTVGEHTRLAANVTLCGGVTLGRRCLLHPGVVIGADGFGIARDRDGWVKVPQIGGVSIGDDVEIGANTTVDRGAVEDTVIASGVKLDNQIQVAHNVRIGEHTAIAGCTAIAGSTTIGARCMIAGGVGIAGHLDIADDVVVTAMTLVSHSISAAGVYSGSLPQDAARQWRKNSVRFKHLDEMARRLDRLERKQKKGQ